MYGGTPGCEQTGNGKADTASASGYDGRFTGQIEQLIHKQGN
jgi:hypothetical protein